MGCRYCMVACPFSVPRYEWSKAVPAVRKCDGCIERQKDGKTNACAEACPAEATVAGTREELLAEAKKRIAENPGTYYPEVYGEHEVGGTNVLHPLARPVRAARDEGRARHRAAAEPHLGRPVEDPRRSSASGCVGLSAIYWITHRREEVAAAERREKERPLMRREERFRPGFWTLRLLPDHGRGRRRHRPPLLEGARRGHEPLRQVPLGPLGRLRRAVRRRRSPPAASRSRPRCTSST